MILIVMYQYLSFYSTLTNKVILKYHKLIYILILKYIYFGPSSRAQFLLISLNYSQSFTIFPRLFCFCLPLIKMSRVWSKVKNFKNQFLHHFSSTIVFLPSPHQGFGKFKCLRIFISSSIGHPFRLLNTKSATHSSEITVNSKLDKTIRIFQK